MKNKNKKEYLNEMEKIIKPLEHSHQEISLYVFKLGGKV